MISRHGFNGPIEMRLEPAEQAVIEDAVVEVRDVEARRVIVRSGVELTMSTLLLEGFVGRQVDGRDGVRQLVAVQVSGDFVDLHGYPLRHLDHDVVTLTAARIALIPHAALRGIEHDRPDLARKLWRLTMIDAAMHRQWVFRLGRLRAVQRVAHFLCETSLRLYVVGRSDGLSYRLPLTQFDIADVCGLTSIHVNRVMRELREGGLCTVRASQVEIHDLPALSELAEFDPAYLYLDRELLVRYVRSTASASASTNGAQEAP